MCVYLFLMSMTNIYTQVRGKIDFTGNEEEMRKCGIRRVKGKKQKLVALRQKSSLGFSQNHGEANIVREHINDKNRSKRCLRHGRRKETRLPIL